MVAPTLIAIAALTTVAAAPLKPTRATKVSIIPSFNVTGLHAQALVLSHRASFTFNLTYSPDLPQVSCWALGTQLDEELGSIPETWCGSSATNVSFQWTKNDDGTADLTLRRVVDEDKCRDQALYTIPKKDTIWKGTGQFRHQVYVGPQNISVPAIRMQYDESD